MINPAGLALAGPIAAAFVIGTALVVAALVIAVPNLIVCVLPSVRGVRRVEPEPETAAPPVAAT